MSDLTVKKAAVILNELCGTDIKVNFVKKDAIEEAFVEAMESGLKNVPAEVQEFYNDNFVVDPVEPEPEVEPESEVSEEPGPEIDSLEVLMAIANQIEGFEIDPLDSDNVKEIRSTMLDFLDDMKEDDWHKLPKPVKDWNVEALQKEEDDKKAASQALAESGPKKDGKTPKAKKEPRKRKDGKAPRPDFVFEEGTSSRQIMDLFNSSVDETGIEMKKFVEICQKAKITGTSNLPGRVATTLRYASYAEGGCQAVKIKNLWYKKGMVPSEE